MLDYKKILRTKIAYSIICWLGAKYIKFVSFTNSWSFINKKYQIVYEPDASVYHHHGLHHSNTKKRLDGVIKIIKSIEKDNLLPDMLDISNQNTGISNSSNSNCVICTTTCVSLTI